MVKEVIVKVRKYEDSAGCQHDSMKLAEISQAKIDGKAKVCPACSGTKKLLNEDGRGHYPCRDCDKYGLVWKKTVWT